MMKETEAKSKDCPLAPLMVLASTACGEIPSDYTDFIKCKASECAIWIHEKTRLDIDYYQNGKKTNIGRCGLTARTE